MDHSDIFGVHELGRFGYFLTTLSALQTRTCLLEERQDVSSLGEARCVSWERQGVFLGMPPPSGPGPARAGPGPALFGPAPGIGTGSMALCQGAIAHDESYRLSSAAAAFPYDDPSAELQ